MFSIRLITNQGSWVMILPAGWVSMFSKYHVSGRVGSGRVGSGRGVFKTLPDRVGPPVLDPARADLT